jgi:anti-sigma regulatory factor (Ser/Thr protein kinase)
MMLAEITPQNPHAHRGAAPWSMSTELPRNGDCASLARRRLAQYAEAELSPREPEDASLIISELAANAFRHGRGRIEMKVGRRADRLRLEITGEGNSPRIDAVPEGERDAGGYGLWLVSQLGSDWGTAGSTCVWAELTIGTVAAA